MSECRRIVQMPPPSMRTNHRRIPTLDGSAEGEIGRIRAVALLNVQLCFALACRCHSSSVPSLGTGAGPGNIIGAGMSQPTAGKAESKEPISPEFQMSVLIRTVLFAIFPTNDLLGWFPVGPLGELVS